MVAQRRRRLHQADGPARRSNRAGAPEATAAADGGLPPMAGQLVRDGADLCFVPRFAFLDGTAYTVTVEGATAATLVRARPGWTAATEVADIRPTAAEVPCNLLRLYVWFSGPMSEGYAAGNVRLADDGGCTIPGALLPGEHELWDASRRRLTVLLDPARIKRGLAGHREAGYPLRPGEPFRLVVDSGFRDAQGLPLRADAQRRYEVGGEERRHVDPASWVLTVPPAGTSEPVQVAFGRPLDHGLLARCLHVAGPGGELIHGTPADRPRGAGMAAGAPPGLGTRFSPAHRRSRPGGPGRQLGQPGVRPRPHPSQGRAAAGPAGHGLLPAALTGPPRCLASAA